MTAEIYRRLSRVHDERRTQLEVAFGTSRDAVVADLVALARNGSVPEHDRQLVRLSLPFGYKSAGLALALQELAQDDPEVSSVFITMGLHYGGVMQTICSGKIPKALVLNPEHKQGVAVSVLADAWMILEERVIDNLRSCTDGASAQRFARTYDAIRFGHSARMLAKKVEVSTDDYKHGSEARRDYFTIVRMLDDPTKMKELLANTPDSQAILDPLREPMIGDAPFCFFCKQITVKRGAKYHCLNCGHSME